jgi:signal transduction histidine kinase
MALDAAELITALDALLIEISPGGLVALRPWPSWTERFDSRERLADRFPFLEIFLEGDLAWNDRLGSEVWTQRDIHGEEQVLEAIPLAMNGRRLLLVRRPGREFDQRRGELQMARDRGLARDRLERVNRLKTEFLSSMNHELRTPLHAVAGFSTLLLQERESQLSAAQQGFVREIQTAARHMTELIDEALDLARIEAGQVVLTMEHADAGEMVLETVASVRALAAEKRIAVDTLTSDGVFAWVDRRRFRQILYNLLSNAMNFTPSEGRVTVECTRRAGGGARIAVSDTGPGIGAAQQSLIFEPFYQTDHSKGGSGLGLAITQRLVKEHGGEIRVQSEPGKGSVFTVELPGS